MKKIGIILSVLALIASSCTQATKKQVAEENPQSDIRPNEKLELDKIYTDNFEYVDYSDGEYRGLIYLKKDDREIVLYDDTPEEDTTISVLKRGDKVKIQWRLERFYHEGGGEFYVDVFAEKITKIKENNLIIEEELTDENHYRGYKFGEDFSFKDIKIYDTENFEANFTADDSIYTSNIRPDEKLTVGKIYTNNFEYLDYNDEGDNLSIVIIKSGKAYTLIANELWDYISQFNEGELVEVQWKIDFLVPAGDNEIAWIVKFAEKMTKIKAR